MPSTSTTALDHAPTAPNGKDIEPTYAAMYPNNVKVLNGGTSVMALPVGHDIDSVMQAMGIMGANELSPARKRQS